jgi:hypothetical protein
LRHHRRSQPAISCLGAFRPPAVGVRGETIIPAAENLHNFGLMRRGKRSLFDLRSATGGLKVIRLKLGNVALWVKGAGSTLGGDFRSANQVFARLAHVSVIRILTGDCRRKGVHR